MFYTSNLKMLRQRYDEKYLRIYAEEHKIILYGEYKALNQGSRIQGKCRECENIFEKSFLMMVRTGNLCKSCTTEIKGFKFRSTCIERFGTENPFQNESIKEKIKASCMDKFGVSNPMKSEEVKDKSKSTCLKNWGFGNPSQSKEVRGKFRATCFKNLGVSHPLQSEEVKEKSRVTCLKNFGVPYSLQSEEVKIKIRATSMINFGVQHHMQNSAIASKSLNNALKKKTYTFPSGNVIFVQGYENYALDDLLSKGYDEEDLLTDRKDVPEIWYIDNKGKRRRYYVDIYIPKINKCIEVKSAYTFQKPNVFEKMDAVIDTGYDCEILIVAPHKMIV